MRKKLIKYTKFIISVALIVSLIAPSYAALSASDGSAFVTKAEFDSALADFNSRLTTFEAGINSKIDSQVTSYLDRNGIWSGKTQTVLLDAWVDRDGKTYYRKALKNWPGNTITDNDNGHTLKSLGLSSNFTDNALSKYKICSCNKSGLAYIMWSILDSDRTADARAKYSIWTTAAYRPQAAWSLRMSSAIYWGIDFAIGDSWTALKNAISISDYSVGCWSSAGWVATNVTSYPTSVAVLVPGTRVSLFFVDSNTDLWYRERFNGNANGDNNETVNMQIQQIKPAYFYVDECKIY